MKQIDFRVIYHNMGIEIVARLDMARLYHWMNDEVFDAHFLAIHSPLKRDSNWEFEHEDGID